MAFLASAAALVTVSVADLARHRGCLARLPRRLGGLVADVLEHALQGPGLRGAAR